LPAAPGRLALLFMAQNFRLKGLSCLLGAFREANLLGLQADLLIVGTRSGSNRAFPSLARRLGIGSQVHFLGSVPDAEMPGIYRSCDAYVHPTFSDHCSLVVLEALACGLPVVTTRQNGAAELMRDGREGLILDRPDDIAALAGALLRLQNAQTLAEMSAAAVRLRPQIDFRLHARRVAAWLTAEPSAGAIAAADAADLKPTSEVGA
jgi:UDP-glucose:(heptosyl)LPS alpha-1,3-glucosyltransferase